MFKATADIAAAKTARANSAAAAAAACHRLAHGLFFWNKEDNFNEKRLKERALKAAKEGMSIA